MINNIFIKYVLKNYPKTIYGSYNFIDNTFTYYFIFWFKSTNKKLQEKIYF